MIVRAIVGPMFSSKSTQLFYHIEKYVIAGRKVVLVRPDKDTRNYFSHSIVDEKLKLLIEQNKVQTLYTNDLSDKDFSFFDAVFIDEFFMIKNCIDVFKKHYNMNIHFYCAGLIADSDAEMWPEVVKVLPYVDEITKLQGVCTQCGSMYGNHSYFKNGEKTKLHIGDEGEYECLCSECFLKRLDNEYR